MFTPKKIFVSASNLDINSCRDLIKKEIEILGHIPVELINFQDARDSEPDLLRKTIDDCDILIYVVGKMYGKEPVLCNSSEPRRSYAQKEYDTAVKLGKPVYVLICMEQFPYNDYEPEDETKVKLQLKHRKQLQSDDHSYSLIRAREQIKFEIQKIVGLDKPLKLFNFSLKRKAVYRFVGFLVSLIVVLDILFARLFVVSFKVNKKRRSLLSKPKESRLTPTVWLTL